MFTAQACQKSTVHSSTIRTPCRRHQKTTGKIKCTPSSPKKYSATGPENHTRVFLTQKKKTKQNKTKQQQKKHSCASPHNCSNGPFILGPCSVCLPLGSYEACEPTYHIMVPIPWSYNRQVGVGRRVDHPGLISHL